MKVIANWNLPKKGSDEREKERKTARFRGQVSRVSVVHFARVRWKEVGHFGLLHFCFYSFFPPLAHSVHIWHSILLICFSLPLPNRVFFSTSSFLLSFLNTAIFLPSIMPTVTFQNSLNVNVVSASSSPGVFSWCMWFITCCGALEMILCAGGFPLRELIIDQRYGWHVHLQNQTGQIRALSRLYFYWKWCADKSEGTGVHTEEWKDDLDLSWIAE